TIPIGTDDTGHEIVVRVGRYGPYVQREDSETASLPPEIAPDELTVELALDMIATQAAGPTALGTDPETELPVYVLTGRYGPYVTDGATNATVPRGTDPAELTLAEAVALLRARAEMGPRKAAKKTAKKAAKKTTKKPAKKTPKKATKKAAKKAAKKPAAP